MAQRVSFDPGGLCVLFCFWLYEITLLASITLLHFSRAATDVDLNGVLDGGVRHNSPDTNHASPVRAVVEQPGFRSRGIPMAMTMKIPHMDMYIGSRNKAVLQDKLIWNQRDRTRIETSGAISNRQSEISDLFPISSVLQRVLDQGAAGLIAHKKINDRPTAVSREVHLHRTHRRNTNTGDGDSTRVNNLIKDIDRTTNGRQRTADHLHFGLDKIEDKGEGGKLGDAIHYRHKRGLLKRLKGIGQDRVVRSQPDPNATESTVRTTSPKQTNQSDSIGREPTETPVLVLPTTLTTTVRETTTSLSTPDNSKTKTEVENSNEVATIAPPTSNAVQTPSPTSQLKAPLPDATNNDTIEEKGISCNDPNCYASRLPYHWTKDATWALVSILFLLFVLTFFVLYTGLWKKRNPMPYPLEHRHIPDHGSRRVNIAELLRTRLAAIPKRFRNRHLRFGKGLNRKKYEELPLHRPNGRCGDDDYDFDEDGEEDLYTRDEHSV